MSAASITITSGSETESIALDVEVMQLLFDDSTDTQRVEKIQEWINKELKLQVRMKLQSSLLDQYVAAHVTDGS